VRRACKSSTRCAAVGEEAPRSADSMVPRSCFGDTIFSPVAGETLTLEEERGKREVRSLRATRAGNEAVGFQ